MADKMDKHIAEDEIEATLDFVRNWVEDVRALASKWNSDEQRSSTGDALEFQAEYLRSLLCLVWEDVHGVDKASSREIRSYMSEMANWISKVHVHRYSAKKDVLVPLKSSAVVCNGAPASPASPTYQVFDEMLEPIDDSEMSLNSPELLPEEVHHQTEVQLEGYGTPIFPSKIAISSPPCPSSVQSSKIQVLSKDPVEVESTTPDSVNLKLHTAATTELSTKLLQDLVGLDSCALEAKQIDDCESLQPFEMVIGISAELLAYFSARKLFVRMSPWSNEVIDSICGLPFVLTCFMKSSTASFVCMAENLVFDPGGFKTTDLELLVALGAHDLFVELPQRDALWSTMTDWTFLLDNVLEFTVEHFPYDRGKYKLFMSSKDASKGLLMEFLGLGFHLDSLGLMGSLTALSHPRNWCPFEMALLAVFSCFLCCILLHTGVEPTLLVVAVIFYLMTTTKSGWWLCAFSCYCCLFLSSCLHVFRWLIVCYIELLQVHDFLVNFVALRGILDLATRVLLFYKFG